MKAIKIICKYCIEIAVMDEASAIDGTRPLEQVADACGYAWGATCLQMTEDLSRLKLLLMTGKSFSPPQQTWQPLILEGAAQLAGKRQQRKILGPMWSLCWTDHSNLTRQQNADSGDIIDPKMLRWTTEINANGSELRSLGGRSARLGDGTSRNPKDRDELIEQRTKDLKGLVGQVRGFRLEDYLDDMDEPGCAVPWAVGDDAWEPEGTLASGMSPDAGPAAAAPKEANETQSVQGVLKTQGAGKPAHPTEENATKKVRFEDSDHKTEGGLASCPTSATSPGGQSDLKSAQKIARSDKRKQSFFMKKWNQKRSR